MSREERVTGIWLAAGLAAVSRRTAGAYVQAHSEASFSHGMCLSCLVSLYPGLPPVQ